MTTKTNTNGKEATMHKHTPGPWNLVKERKPMIAPPRWVPEAEIRGKGGMRTVVRLGKLTSTEAKANARLIALTPELLEACRLAVQYLDERDGDRSRPNPVRELLDTVVAKAEMG